MLNKQQHFIQTSLTNVKKVPALRHLSVLWLKKKVILFLLLRDHLCFYFNCTKSGWHKVDCHLISDSIIRMLKNVKYTLK